MMLNTAFNQSLSCFLAETSPEQVMDNARLINSRKLGHVSININIIGALVCIQREKWNWLKTVPVI